MNKLVQFSRAIIAIAMLLAVSSPSFAYDFEADGIYYNITDEIAKTVEVTYKGESYVEYYDEYAEKVIIPESVSYNGETYLVTSIGEAAFGHCSKLNTVFIPNTVISIGNSAFVSSSITEIIIPNSVTTIGDYAFAACNEMTSVTIPNSVISIAEFAFYWCFSLRSVTIGSSVSSIGDYAFAYCRKLQYVTSLNLTPPACGAGVFNNRATNASLTVPESAISAYKSADVWRDFYEIEVAGANNIVTTENSITSVARYDANGRLLSEPTPGINIIKMSDGSTRKVWVK